MSELIPHADQVLTYNAGGRVFKHRDFLWIMAERLWNSANPRWRGWDKQSDKMKIRFVHELRAHIADIKMFKPGGNVAP